MRPNGIEYGSELHECIECGARVDTPESRTCGECGGPLRNISTPRDL